MHSIINAASKVLKLQGDMKKTTLILEDILILQPIDHEIEANLEHPLQHELIEIIQGYSLQDKRSINSKKGITEDEICELSNHVCLALSRKFELRNDSKNFNIAQPKRWMQLLETLTDTTGFAVVIQIIIILSNTSLINKQNLGSLKQLRSQIFEILLKKIHGNVNYYRGLF